MNSWKYIGQIDQENKTYKLYTNNNHEKTFLEVLPDKSLSYLSEEDYIKLDKKFNKRNFSTIHPVTYNFEPKVIRNKALISASVALLSAGILAGCRGPVKTELNSNGQNRIVQMGNTYLVYNDDEFIKMLKEKKATFDDCRNAVEENDKIPLKYKRMFYDFIDRLEMYGSKDFKPAILCHNLRNLTVKVVTIDEIHEKTGNNNSAAYFDSGTIEMVLPEELDKLDDLTLLDDYEKTILDHESIHMCYLSSIKKGNKIYQRCIEEFLLNEIDEDDVILYGEALNEALTELTASYINREYVATGYIAIDDATKVILDSLNIMQGENTKIIDRINYFMENDVSEFIRYSESVGLDNTGYLIDVLDAMLTDVNDRDFTINARAGIYKEVLGDMAQDQIAQGLDAEEIHQNINSVLKDTYMSTYNDMSLYYDQSSVVEQVWNEVDGIFALVGQKTNFGNFKEDENDAKNTNNTYSSIDDTQNSDIYDNLYVISYLDETGEKKYSIVRKTYDEDR